MSSVEELKSRIEKEIANLEHCVPEGSEYTTNAVEQGCMNYGTLMAYKKVLEWLS